MPAHGHVTVRACLAQDAALIVTPQGGQSFNAVFAKYFTAHPPARSTVQSALMVDAKVEMDVIAYKPV